MVSEEIKQRFQPRKNYIVEFTGTSGVGKSFIKAMLMQRLRDEGVDAQTPRLRCADLLNPCALPVINESLRFVISSHPVTLKVFYESLRAWTKKQLLYRNIRSSGVGVYVIDEGIMHKIRRLRRNSRFDFMIKDVPAALLQKIIMPDLVIFVEAPADEIIKRRIKRDGYWSKKPKKTTKKLQWAKTDKLTINDINAVPGLKSFFYNNSNLLDEKRKKEIMDDLILTIKADITDLQT